MPSNPIRVSEMHDSQEAKRLLSLARHQVMDTPPDSRYDDITQLAAYICGTPIALVSLVDANRQWFKSRVGLNASQTPREIAFCAHAIKTPRELFVVPDTKADPLFANNPLVTEDPNIRFYAGAPLVLKDSNQPAGTLCVIDKVPRDLTEEQFTALQALARQVSSNLALDLANQHLSSLNEELDDFARLASHDLRAPIRHIRSFARLIREETELEGNAITYLNHVEQASDSMATLVEDMVGYARLGHTDKRFDFVELNGPISKVIDQLATTYTDVTTTVESESLPQIYGQASLLEALFHNLLENAFKYGRQDGQLNLSITVTSSASHHRIAVADRGPGIPQGQEEVIFQAFKRGSSSKGEPGSGLGLASCKKILTQHGGSITAANRASGGAIFELLFPIMG